MPSKVYVPDRGGTSWEDYLEVNGAAAIVVGVAGTVGV